MDRFRIHHFETLSSTQTEARRDIYDIGDVIMADIQTAGYGRRGRSWQGPTGNLCITLIEEFLGYDQLSWLGYAIGLGLYDAIAPLLNENAQLQLKWPNDLLINEKKLSGILIEIENDHILIGIGLNVAVTPETDQPVTTVNANSDETHIAVDILNRFLPCYDLWYRQGEANGFEAMREAWLSRAAFIGEPITARLANGLVLTGVFKDIDKQGALVLATETSHYTVTAADIYINQEK
jgi:BirA family transcriptional regulator, biotin operon repressor / biotin---[acetyl-CoA-carboxylase] ligase